MNPYSYARAVIDTSPDMPSGTRLVLLALAGWVNKAGYAWPSSSTLARFCGFHPGSVRRSLDALDAAGIIIAERRPGRSTRYRWPLQTSLSTTPRPGREVADEIVDPAPMARHPAHTARTPRALGATELDKELEKNYAGARETETDTTPQWFVPVLARVVGS